MFETSEHYFLIALTLDESGVTNKVLNPYNPTVFCAMREPTTEEEEDE